MHVINIFTTAAIHGGVSPVPFQDNFYDDGITSSRCTVIPFGDDSGQTGFASLLTSQEKTPSGVATSFNLFITLSPN